MRSFGKRSKMPWKIISVISGIVSETAVAPIATAACFDAAVFVCLAASSRWMLTGMSSSAAASQKGSSSGRSVSPPDGQAEIATP
jgi:hypothetical protein